MKSQQLEKIGFSNKHATQNDKAETQIWKLHIVQNYEQGLYKQALQQNKVVPLRQNFRQYSPVVQFDSSDDTTYKLHDSYCFVPFCLSPSSSCNSLTSTVFTRIKNMIHLTFPSKCPSFRKGIHVFLTSLITIRNRNKIRYNFTKRQFIFKCWVKTVVFKTNSPLVIHIQCIETKWNFPENS